MVNGYGLWIMVLEGKVCDVFFLPFSVLRGWEGGGRGVDSVMTVACHLSSAYRAAVLQVGGGGTTSLGDQVVGDGEEVEANALFRQLSVLIVVERLAREL